MNAWYFARNGQTYGPFTESELHQQFELNRFQTTDFVWHANFGAEWRPYCDVFREKSAASEETVFSPRFVSIFTTAKRAFGKMTDRLFTPFSFLRWLSFTLCVWLSITTVGLPFSELKVSPGEIPELKGILSALFEQLKTLSLRNFAIWLVFAAILIWFNTRGNLMLLYRLDEPELPLFKAWQRSARDTPRLFCWNLAIAAGLFIPATFVLFVHFLHPEVAALRAPIYTILAAVIFVAMLILQSLTWQFLIPLMHLRNRGLDDALRTLRKFLAQNFLIVLGYYLALPLWNMIAAAFLFVFFQVTGLIGMILFSFPYTNALFFLPYHIFRRSLGLIFLRELSAAEEK